MFGDLFKSFEINFDAPNGRDCFSCGDVISGRIIFDLSKEMRVNSLILILKGKAMVKWNSGSNNWHVAREDYFNMKSDIVPQNGLAASYAVTCAGETVLRSGTHVYPFRMQLPVGDFPSSFQGYYGRVAYTLVVEVQRPWHFAKEYRTELKFISHKDADPQLLVPLSASNSKVLCCLCCTSGSVSMNVHLERKVYIPGEMIKIIAEFENSSSRTIVPKATLVQTQTFYTTPRTESKTIHKELAWVEGSSLMPYSAGAWGNEMLQIPADAPLTISNCQILEVEYCLWVRLYIPFGTCLKVVIPLVISTIPVFCPAVF